MGWKPHIFLITDSRVFANLCTWGVTFHKICSSLAPFWTDTKLHSVPTWCKPNSYIGMAVSHPQSHSLWSKTHTHIRCPNFLSFYLELFLPLHNDCFLTGNSGSSISDAHSNILKVKVYRLSYIEPEHISFFKLISQSTRWSFRWALLAIAASIG